MFRFTHDEHVPELSSVDPATNVLARLRLRSKERTTIWLIAYHRKMVHYSHSFWFSDLNKIWTELLDSYLNGPRTLSNERLSFLVVSQDPTHEGGSNEGLQDNRSTNGNYDILICATHFLGDGMAVHTFANDFFNLLCNNNEVQLHDLLQKEWILRCDGVVDPVCLVLFRACQLSH